MALTSINVIRAVSKGIFWGPEGGLNRRIILYIQFIQALPLSPQELTTSFYLRQEWLDTRLNFTDQVADPDSSVDKGYLLRFACFQFL